MINTRSAHEAHHRDSSRADERRLLCRFSDAGKGSLDALGWPAAEKRQEKSQTRSWRERNSNSRSPIRGHCFSGLRSWRYRNRRFDRVPQSRRIAQDRWFADSPLEGGGFEPSVPGREIKP